jgi:hypothetical protein
VSARIEDQVYFKYNVELEEIAAYYQNQGKRILFKKFMGFLGLDNLDDSDLMNLRQSTSALLKLNRSVMN